MKFDYTKKIQSVDALKGLLSGKVVFTNGCFDILHVGHITYLQQARSLGDVLVVALNSDDSVKRLKGEERPVNGLIDRMSLIAALEAVTWVTWFEQDDPVSVIRALKPNVLVKGGDHAAEGILGGEDVRSWGGEVLSLSFVGGKSTTSLIDKVRKK